MASESENQNVNPSEFINEGDPALIPPLTNDVSGLTYGLTYTPNENNRSLFSPTNFIFDQTSGLSNGYKSRVSGITDFTAYNDYIHYLPVGMGLSFNVYRTLVKATTRFEIYSRQYRT